MINSRALEMRREYQRAWRAANKEKVKKYNDAYWEKKAQERKKEQEKGKGEPDERR